MDALSNGFWHILGALWPVAVAIALLLWFMGSMGGLLGVIANGIAHVAQFGVNFLARTVALAALLGLVLIAMLVFNSIGAPDIRGFFPKNATTPLSVTAPAAPAGPPAPATP